ncbi:MAG TPA: hypothetical protein VNT75_01530 [Symbiobacteriaceae bacterium]|nr:hypothetical protein [Symbiobacteriaceae bacterium]
MTDRADRLFFDYCLAHGRRSYELEAPAPALLPREAARELVRAARLIYRALERCSGAWPVPPFPLRELCLAPGGRVEPPFWARFDGFRREGGGVFFAELNLDRPGGHREALAAPRSGPAFRRRFLRALRRRWPFVEVPRMAFLVDPAHREELHIAHLYAGLAGELGWPCTVVGPLNLSVRGDQAFAFDEPVDMVMRQFPTEFGHEVPGWGDLVRLHRDGKLLLLNDPLAVRGQAKTCFAWLWEQVLAGGGLLTEAEAEAVRATVPFTAWMASAETLGDLPAPLALLEYPERWVLKPVLGRYSQGVTCGALVPPDVWGAAVAAALAEPEYWVAQEYVPIAPQPLTRGNGEQVAGYVNWGLHFLNGRPAGWLARCSATPLTDDAWFTEACVTEEGADGTASEAGA